MRAKPGSSMKPFGKNSHMLALFEWRPYRESMRKSYAVQAIIFDLDGTLSTARKICALRSMWC